MLRARGARTAAAAAYGYSIGVWHSARYGARNLVKFPLLLLVTTAVCALACFLTARLLTPKLAFRDVQNLVLRLYAAASVLLASLAPVNLFLAATLVRPASHGALNDYPLFLGLNVAFIAVSGSLALVKQASELLHRHRLGPWTSASLICAWLALALAVGAQWAWYLRPFFGISAPGIQGFCLGTQPDFRGATSFYEAVYHLVVPPGR